MKFIHINPISRSIVYLKQLSETEAEVGTATGFLYQSNRAIFLVTNKHVVTGRNMQNGKVLSKTGALPNLIKANIATIEKSPEGEGKVLCRRVELRINLYGHNGDSLWLEHEDEKVDIVAIKTNLSEIGGRVSPLNENRFYNFPIEIADNVFILGYPAGITGGKKLPIWKRGTVASEPAMDFDDMHRFIIDTSTREGMSGAPVIVRSDIMLAGLDGMIPDDEFFGAHYQFVGIYSGRLNSKTKEDDFTTQLGVVWKKEYLEQILNSFSIL